MPKGSDRPPRECHHGEAGVTLVELAVAVLILALVLGLSAPALPRPRSGADAAADALARLLDRGRLAALRDGTEVEVRVDAASGAWRVVAPGADGADSLLGDGTLPRGGEVRMTVPGGEPEAVIRFGPLGRAEGGPVRVRDVEGRERVVAVDPWTGRIHVEAE